MPSVLHRPSGRPMPIAIGVSGHDLEAVTAAIALADGGYAVTLHVASPEWLDALANGELPFHAPHLLAPLRAAFRAELLDIVPQPLDAAAEGGLTRRPVAGNGRARALGAYPVA